MISMSFIRKTIFTAALIAAPAAAFGQFSISVNFAPPILPVYAQPLCPGDGYIWTPGYWAYNEDDGYFWVPGVWVEPPTVGYLWTPAYWGYQGDIYRFYPGYWGPHIGFYGGVNYGFGYFGHGYEGGYWDRDRFFYNRSVNNINVVNVHNVYVRNVTVVNNYNRVSYNGGPSGVRDRPQQQELLAQRERHFEPTHTQVEHQQLAGQDRGQFASVNNGRPQTVAARTPQDFQQHLQRAGFGNPGSGNQAGGNRQNNQQINAGPATPNANRGGIGVHDNNVRANAPIDRQTPNSAMVPQPGRGIGQLNQANPINQTGQRQNNVTQPGSDNRRNPDNIASPQQQPQQPYGQRQNGQLPQTRPDFGQRQQIQPQAPQQQQQVRQPQATQQMQQQPVRQQQDYSRQQQMQQRQQDYGQQRQAQQAAQQQQAQQARQQQMQQQQAAQQQARQQQMMQQQQARPQVQQQRPQPQPQAQAPQQQQHPQGGHEDRPRR